MYHVTYMHSPAACIVGRVIIATSVALEIKALFAVMIGSNRDGSKACFPLGDLFRAKRLLIVKIE